MEIYYKNHKGKTIDFINGFIHISNFDELFSNQFEYDNLGKIQNYYTKGLTSFNISLEIEGDWKNIINNLNDIVLEDIMCNEKGQFVIDQYSLFCNINAVRQGDCNYKHGYAQCEITISSDAPVWVKSERYTFVSAATPTEGHDTKRYPHTYSYHYRPRIGQSVLYSQLSMPAHYQIIIYGPVTNPSVTIGGNVYQVSVELLANEYLVIDYSNTGTRTITVYHQDGQSEDKFGARSKQFSVFTKINPGRQPVLWSGDFAFDIILFDERSQPKWI